MFRFLLGPAILLAAAFTLIAQPARAQSMMGGTFDPAIPTLQQISGYAPGDAITTPADMRRYFEALAKAAPDRVKIVDYARSWQGPVVFADGNLVLQPLTKARGTNVIRFADAQNLVASGHVWDANQQQMAFKPHMIAQPHGSGLAIGFKHDPSVRGYLDGLDMLLANAVLIAPSRVR